MSIAPLSAKYHLVNTHIDEGQVMTSPMSEIVATREEIMKLMMNLDVSRTSHGIDGVGNWTLKECKEGLVD